jgi:hypothetical protein
MHPEHRRIQLVFYGKTTPDDITQNEKAAKIHDGFLQPSQHFKQSSERADNKCAKFQKSNNKIIRIKPAARLP